MDQIYDADKAREEFVKASREALTKDRQRRDAFEGLLKHTGWGVFQELMNSMIEQRAQQILAPAGSVDGAMLLEHVKGTMNGLILARDLPSLIVNAVPAPQLEDDEDES